MHKHEFKVYEENAVGSYSKRDCGVDAVFVTGTVVTCECGAAQIIPDAKWMRPVPVEL